jgi:hypothetical protein
MINLIFKHTLKYIIKRRPYISAENFKIKHYVYFQYLTFNLNTKHES